MEEVVEAMAMSEKNPLYVKFLKEKDQIEKDVAEKRAKFQAKKLKKAQRKNKTIKVDPFTTDDEYDESEYLFLCYVTRKYFKDCMLVSVVKEVLGIVAIIVSVLLENIRPLPLSMKPVLMSVLLFYGIIMIPLSLLYIFANLSCYLRYSEYVTTRTSVLSKKINHFYASSTDKLMAVNWGNVFARDKLAYSERRRMRGW